MKNSSTITLGSSRKYFWSSPLKLRESEIKQHKHIFGLSGMGKSKLIASMATQLIESGIPVSLVDPHSDLADDILSLLYEKGYFDKNGYSKLIYIDFSRQDRFLPFNVLNQSYDIHTVARNIVEACMRVWPSLNDGNSPLFEQIVLASVFLLIENKLPLTELDALLTDNPYRETLLKKCSDPKIISFFRNQFDRWSNKDAALMIGSTLRRSFLLSFTPALRYSLGQSANVLNFRRILDEGISVIFDLGGLDEQSQKIIGCLITVGFEQAALSRADIPESERKPYQLILDEFSMFSSGSSESLSRMLSLVRKFGLTISLANQTFSQADMRLQSALENCLSIYFRLGKSDAEWGSTKIGRYNMLDTKQVDADTRTLVAFQNSSDQRMKWADELANLAPRECYVNGTKIRTIDVKINPANKTRVEHIKDYFAHTLLVSKERIIQMQTKPLIKVGVRKKKVV